jgi:hypothetical protein
MRIVVLGFGIKPFGLKFVLDLDHETPEANQIPHQIGLLSLFAHQTQ